MNITALQNISFTVKKGETLAILGKQVPKINDFIFDIENVWCNEGKITIDGNKLCQSFDLRNSIGIVPQDAFLFSDSIKKHHVW
jgi:ATP-binding cassette subfamily B protein